MRLAFLASNPPAAARPAGRASSLASLAIPVVAGIVAALALVGVYIGLVTWAQGISHARELLWSDRYFVGAIALGFGVQAGLFVHVRRLLSAATRRPAAAATATGAGMSSAAMIACCAHHVTEALPVLGLSGAAIFLNDYRIPLMAAGLGMNAAGVAYMIRLVVFQRRRMAMEVGA